MTTVSSPSQACHNCRRRRWKCDRGLPHCLKCIKHGQECLGYQQLFRWEKGMASRGRLSNRTIFAKEESHPTLALSDLLHGSSSTQRVSWTNIFAPYPRLMLDPWMQGLQDNARQCVLYFASQVCKDLVLYDDLRTNRFRDLIPLAQYYPALLQIIIANAAVHLTNVHQKQLSSGGVAHFVQQQAPQRQSYQLALVAKQKALSLLQAMLYDLATAGSDVLLATILLFIEFELLDSGRDRWRYHVNGAKAIIHNICGETSSNMTCLRQTLISNCIIFDVLGSTLARTLTTRPSNVASTGTLSLLHDEDGNHCSSFPLALIRLLQAGTQILNRYKLHDHHHQSTMNAARKQMIYLISISSRFDSLAWAKSIRGYSPSDDTLQRASVASAHRAAVCVYLCRVLEIIGGSCTLLVDFEGFVTDIITQLVSLSPDDPLFVAIAWPAFIAGAETRNVQNQEYITHVFHKLWEAEPWGIIKGTLGVLEGIWSARNTAYTTNNQKLYSNWILDIQKSSVDWLII